MKGRGARINNRLWETMSKLLIRQAEPGDSDALKMLLDNTWRTHWGPHVNPEGRARYDREMPAHGYVDACLGSFVVAERDGRIVGMYHLDGDYLHAIHVAVDDIGSGVGSALMAEAEADGAARLDVRAFNSRARAFYTARGWRETEERDDVEMGTRVRSIIMVKG